jgi:hypothetical protein
MSLSLLWLTAVAPLILILILRQLGGFYDIPNTDPKDVWTWVTQFVLPGVTLVAGAWTVTTPASDKKKIGNPTGFWIAVGMSAFYFAVLYVVIASQAGSSQPWPETFKQSALYLGIIQGVVIGVVGKFFIETGR